MRQRLQFDLANNQSHLSEGQRVSLHFLDIGAANKGGGSPERGMCDENSNGRVTLLVRAHNNHYDHLSITNGKVSTEGEVRTVLTILQCVQC